MDIRFVLLCQGSFQHFCLVRHKHIPNTHSKVKKILGDYLLLSTSLNV